MSAPWKPLQLSQLSGPLGEDVVFFVCSESTPYVTALGTTGRYMETHSRVVDLAEKRARSPTFLLCRATCCKKKKKKNINKYRQCPLPSEPIRLRSIFGEFQLLFQRSMKIDDGELRLLHTSDYGVLFAFSLGFSV